VIELEPLAASASPSPHRMVAAYADYMEGRKLFEEHAPREQAVALLERAVRANPENHKAWFTLGLAELERQRFEPAAAAFRRAGAMSGGERIPAQLDLAVCLYDLGRTSEALAELEAALAETDGPPGALELLVRLLEENGRHDEAERVRARLIARGQP
jgi:tetratricopeptide (TPR) repeat protein